MVDVAKFFLDFTMDETCGKCTPCRIGSKRLYELLDKITLGQGVPEDLDKLKTLAVTIKDTALCGLGQTMPNPVLSTMATFVDEYKAHVVDKKCPSGVCTNLLEIVIVPEKCVGCTLCARICPVNCISGKVKEVHTIDQAVCIKCGACIPKCKFEAIVKQ
jgi:NADP-reducing hydrogenase subunit HndC